MVVKLVAKVSSCTFRIIAIQFLESFNSLFLFFTNVTIAYLTSPLWKSSNRSGSMRREGGDEGERRGREGRSEKTLGDLYAR